MIKKQVIIVLNPFLIEGKATGNNYPSDINEMIFMEILGVEMS